MMKYIYFQWGEDEMKMMKKTAALTLAMGLLFTSVPYAVLAEAPVMTAGTLSQDQALAKVKETVQLPAGYEFRNASYQEGARNGSFGVPVWMISYSDDEMHSTGWVNAIIDAKTGRLLSYSYNKRDESASENPLSREQAHAKAIEMLKKFAPDKVDQVKEVDAQDSPGFGPYGTSTNLQTFRFVRTVNGVPFPYNAVSIRIDEKGQLREYSVNWNDGIQFPEASAKVTAEQAKDVFEKSLQLQLQYQRSYKPYMTQKVDYSLAYAPGMLSRLPVIDALQGVNIGTDGQPVKEVPTELKTLADKPGAPLATGDLSKEEAAKLVEFYGVNLDGFTLGSSSYQTDSYSNSAMWRLDYTKGDMSNPKQSSMYSIAVDAKTGELRDMYYSDYASGPREMPSNPAVSREQALVMAGDFLKKVAPTQADKIALDPTNQAGKTESAYNFRFLPMVNGVPVTNMTIFLTVDPNTGHVLELHTQGAIQDANGAYPDKAKAIGIDAAKAKFLAHYPLTLQYVPVFDPAKQEYEPTALKGVTLAYAAMSDNSFSLNAISGEWQSSWSGMPAGPVKVTDIKGHWAEKQLQSFADRGIFEPDNGKLYPDNAVSRGDMLKYLVLSFGNSRTKTDKSMYNDVPKSDPNYDFVQEAVARKWISSDLKNFRPNDAITRQELSEIVVNILGYQKLAHAPNTFQDNFTDVSPDNKPFYGDIAIVNSLGLITTNNGYFYPAQSVSKGQTAVIVNRLLDQMKDRAGTMY
jgi:hypothetical protein